MDGWLPVSIAAVALSAWSVALVRAWREARAVASRDSITREIA